MLKRISSPGSAACLFDPVFRRGTDPGFNHRTNIYLVLGYSAPTPTARLMYVSMSSHWTVRARLVEPVFVDSGTALPAGVIFEGEILRVVRPRILSRPVNPGRPQNPLDPRLAGAATSAARSR